MSKAPDSNEFYEWFAEHYPQVYGWRPDSLVERWGRLSCVLRDNGSRTVLDAACGVGRDALELARLGFDVVGVDLSPDMIAVARQQAEAEGLNVEFLMGDLSELCREAGQNRFDAVYGTGGIWTASRRASCISACKANHALWTSMRLTC